MTSATLERGRTGEHVRTEFAFTLPRGYMDDGGDHPIAYADE